MLLAAAAGGNQLFRACNQARVFSPKKGSRSLRLAAGRVESRQLAGRHAHLSNFSIAMKTLSLIPTLIVVATCGLMNWQARPAAAAESGVRIRLGLKDEQPTDWSGTVAVKPGKVVSISGWRFEQDDHANGTEGWTAATRAGLDNRTNAQKAAAKAKANQDGNQKAKGKGAAAKAKAKAGGAAGALGDNGVLLTLTDVTEDSLVSIKLQQGSFEFKLADIPYGKWIDKLDGAV